eukprot:gene9818-7026_t
MGILLLLLFISSFLMQYLEIQPMGKKMGVSFLPLVILQMNNPTVHHQEFIWKVLVSVAFGSAIALIGTILPFPPRMAGTEVRQRLNYFTTTISSLMKNATYSWLIQPIRAVDQRHPPFPWFAGSTRRLSNASSAYSSASSPYRQLKFTRWRKVRLLVNALVAFKRAKHYQLGWIHRSHHRAKDLYTRVEIIKFLQEELEVLVKRNVEARFGPNRSASIRLFGRFVALTRSFLTILLQLEKQVQDLETQSIHYPIYRCFFLSPSFRRRYTALVSAICTGYTQLHHVFILHNFRHDERLVIDAIMAMHAIVETKDLFNREYFKLRKSVYYNLNTTTMPTFGTSTLARNRHNVFSEVVEVPDTPSFAEPQPLVSEVLFNMNTSLQPFQRPVWKPRPKGVNRFLSLRKWWAVLKKASVGVWNDLFPAQRHLWCLGVTYDDSGNSDGPLAPTAGSGNGSGSGSGGGGWYATLTRLWRATGLGRWHVRWQWTAAIEERLKSAFTVAVAMTMAGAFGIYADRPQTVMTSFTIAYLAGGSVSGVNIMACLNRAAGTVIACVYAVTVVYVMELSSMQRAPGIARLFVACAIVGFQYPATYIRSFPLYSYTGTCAGFTVALLLIEYFDQSEFTVTIAVNRIIDTFIAVFIYLVVELGFFAQMSEATLLAILTKVVAGIDQRFSRIYSHIVPPATSTSTAATSRSPIATGGGGGGPAASSLPSPPTPPSSSRLEEVRKLLELETMQSLLQRERDLLPFYKSEPRITSAPALPDRLLQEALHWQEQAMMSLQMMMWVVRSCDDDRLHRQEHRLAEITTVLTQVPDAITGSSLQKTQLKLVNPLVLERRRSLSMRVPGTGGGGGVDGGGGVSATVAATAAAAGEDTAEAMLLPLETQYREVEVYISRALSFLSLSIQQLRHRPRNVYRYPSGDRPPPPPPSDTAPATVTATLLATATALAQRCRACLAALRPHAPPPQPQPVRRESYGDGGDGAGGGDIEAASLGDDSAQRRLRRGEVAVGGGLVVNGRDETIVSLDPVSQLRRIHQARNVDMIRAQQRQQHAAFARTRHRARSRDDGSSRDASDKTAAAAATDGDGDGDAELAPSFGAATKLRHPVAVTVAVSASDGDAAATDAAVPSGGGVGRDRHRSTSSAASSRSASPRSSRSSLDDASSRCGGGGGGGGRRRRGSSLDRIAAAAEDEDEAEQLAYVFFAEVESHEVECLFGSYQQLLENIQARIVEHEVLAAREDVVVLGHEKKPPPSDAARDPPPPHAAAAVAPPHHPTLHTAHSSASLRLPPPSYGDSRFTPAHHEPPSLSHRFLHLAPLLPPASPRRLGPSSGGGGDRQPPPPPPPPPPHRPTAPPTTTRHAVLRIASNKEIKVVNALLNSTRDLLQALRSLSRVISRLQAHRDIRWTQDALKLA